jgi:hypothetical protein
MEIVLAVIGNLFRISAFKVEGLGKKTQFIKADYFFQKCLNSSYLPYLLAPSLRINMPACFRQLKIVRIPTKYFKFWRRGKN